MKSPKPNAIKRPPIVWRDSKTQSLTGLIDESGLWYSHARGDRLWTRGAQLAAWREESGVLHRGELRVEYPGTESAANRWFRTGSKYGILQVRGRMVRRKDMPRYLLAESVRKKKHDAELEALAVQLQKPVYFRVVGIGRFVLDRRLNRWVGQYRLGSKKVELDFPAAEGPLQRKHIDAMLRVLSSLGTWNVRTRAVLVRKAMPLANRYWRLEEQPAFKAATFLPNFRLRSISVFESKNIEFCFSDNEVFGWHDVLIHFRPQGRLVRWDLVG